MPKTKRKLSFEDWMIEVNANVEATCGLSSADLPDVSYHDWYDDGLSPKVAARKAIREATSDGGW